MSGSIASGVGYRLFALKGVSLGTPPTGRCLNRDGSVAAYGNAEFRRVGAIYISPWPATDTVDDCNVLLRKINTLDKGLLAENTSCLSTFTKQIDTFRHVSCLCPF